jgi:hypothetical protein
VKPIAHRYANQWEYLGKMSTDKTCFVIMPISDHPDYPTTGHFHMVFEDLIAPAVTESGYEVQRADTTKAANLIHHDILTKLLNAELAICDISSLNPNVMFELGIRQAFGKLVVILKDESTKSPFDTIPLRYLSYNSTLVFREVNAKREELKKAILETADGVAKGHVNSLVDLLKLRAASIPDEPSSDPSTARFNLIENRLDAIMDRLSGIEGAVRPRITPLWPANQALPLTIASLTNFNDVAQVGPIEKDPMPSRALPVENENRLVRAAMDRTKKK